MKSEQFLEVCSLNVVFYSLVCMHMSECLWTGQLAGCFCLSNTCQLFKSLVLKSSLSPLTPALSRYRQTGKISVSSRLVWSTDWVPDCQHNIEKTHKNQNKREGKQDGSVFLLLYKPDNLSSLEPTFKWKERTNCTKLSSDVYRCSMARDLSCHAPPPLRRKLQHRGSLPLSIWTIPGTITFFGQ